MRRGHVCSDSILAWSIVGILVGVIGTCCVAGCMIVHGVMKKVYDTLQQSNENENDQCDELSADEPGALPTDRLVAESRNAE